MDFTREFGALTPQEFVDQYIVDLNAKVIVAGFDYTYGKRHREYGIITEVRFESIRDYYN